MLTVRLPARPIWLVFCRLDDCYFDVFFLFFYILFILFASSFWKVKGNPQNEMKWRRKKNEFMKFFFLLFLLSLYNISIKVVVEAKNVLVRKKIAPFSFHFCYYFSWISRNNQFLVVFYPVVRFISYKVRVIRTNVWHILVSSTTIKCAQDMHFFVHKTTNKTKRKKKRRYFVEQNVSLVLFLLQLFFLFVFVSIGMKISSNYSNAEQNMSILFWTYTITSKKNQ